LLPPSSSPSALAATLDFTLELSEEEARWLSLQIAAALGWLRSKHTPRHQEEWRPMLLE
jgi:hypothetical protein